MNIVIFNVVSLRSKINRLVLDICLAFMAGVVFEACLDVPNFPDLSGKIQTIEVSVKQVNETYNDPLKINASEDAQLLVDVPSGVDRSQLRCYWFNAGEALDSGLTYDVFTEYMLSSIFRENFIPDKVVLVDREGNSLEKDLQVIVNAPPVLSDSAKPADGDTLWATPTTPIRFSWYAVDRDETVALKNILLVDSQAYNVGTLQSVQQSGFSSGLHTFQVVVIDSYGDRDTLPQRTFTVLDTMEAQ